MKGDATVFRSEFEDVFIQRKWGRVATKVRRAIAVLVISVKHIDSTGPKFKFSVQLERSPKLRTITFTKQIDQRPLREPDN